MMMHRQITVVGLSCLLGASLAKAGGEEHTDFEVGQDGSLLSTLLIEGDADILSGLEPIELALLDDPFSSLNGWFINDESGFEGLAKDEPDEGLFALEPGHEIALHRITFDIGFAMFDESENAILLSDGADFVFPSDTGGGFHHDLIFAAPPETPIGTQFSAEFLLNDLAGIHGPSNSFTLTFLTVPEPATALMLFLGGMGLLGRRRREMRREP